MSSNSNTSGRIKLEPRAPGAPPCDECHLDFHLVAQTPYLNWCWASVTSAVTGFFEGREKRRKRCEIVADVLGRNQKSPRYWACPNGGEGKGNGAYETWCCKSTSKWGLREGLDPREPIPAGGYGVPPDSQGRAVCALQSTGNFYDGVLKNFHKFENVEEQIRKKRPLPIMITWDTPGGGNHYVTVAGCDPSNKFISIADPQAHGSEKQASWHTVPIPGPSGKMFLGEGASATWVDTILTKAKEDPPKPPQA